MSSVEQQLVRDIAAVTEGVVVTDSDLREARQDIEERIAIRRRRERRRTYAAVAAAAVLVAGGITAFLTLGDDDGGKAQPAGRHTIVDPDADWLTGAAPTAQLIQGVWRLDNGDATLQFETSGSVRFTSRGSLFARPDATGTYAIAGDLITMTTTQPGTDVCADAHFAMRASITDVGKMNFVRSGPADAGCSPVPFSFSRGSWEQVLPTSPDLAGVTFSKDRRFEPLTDIYNLFGVLMPQGGGYLVEVAQGGSYYVADETNAVVDRGHWTLRHGDLTFTSAAGSKCAAGDRFVLAQVKNETPGINGIRGTVQRDDCQGGWAASTYFTLAHYSTD